MRSTGTVATTSTRPNATFIVSIVTVIFLSVVSVWCSSAWLSSCKQQKIVIHPIGDLPQQQHEHEHNEKAVASSSSFNDKERQQASKTIINRDKTSSPGLHMCKCLTDNAPTTNHANYYHLPHKKKPKRLRWLHFPKTGTSFISTLWSYSCSTRERYIDLNVDSMVCWNEGTHSTFSMYDFALMRRYPWEMYGAPNFISSGNSSLSSPMNGRDVSLGLVGGTQHFPLSPNLQDKQFLQSDRYKKLVGKKQMMSYGSELLTHNMTVVAFFRQPEERIISAYKDSYHTNGFQGTPFKELVTKIRGAKNGQCKIGDQIYTNPLQCFANYPGVAGCMSRMLTGEKCADSLFHESGLENVAEAIDIILNHLDFVGLTEDWNESICQFHRLFSWRRDGVTGQHVWDQPFQREFANVHKSTKASIGVEALDGFKDVADRAVYEAAKVKFERIVGGERCYKFMSWDEIENEMNNNDDNANAHFLNIDEDGNVCHPLTCSDLGKQCGEWDDGCGSTVICGICDSGKTGLPSTWRVQCVEGKCVDYCPTWEEKGLWFLSNDSPPIMKEVSPSIETRKEEYLSPIEAFEICNVACRGQEDNASATDVTKMFIDTNLCGCGSTTKALKNITLSDFSSAHDMLTSCANSKVRKSLMNLKNNDTQPICCPLVNKEKLQQEKQWKKLYQLGGPQLEGSYFAHIHMGCGGLNECQDVAREKEAEIAVFDIKTSYCHLARNAFELDNLYTVAKDADQRYILDLRNPVKP